MELADCQGVWIFVAFDGYHDLNSSAIEVIRHVGPMTPLGGLGEPSPKRLQPPWDFVDKFAS